MNNNKEQPLFVISGNFPESGIAVPAVGRRMLKKIFRELARYKGKTTVDRLKLCIAVVLASNLFLKIFSKKKIVPVGEGIIIQIHNLFEDYIFPICSGSNKFLIPLFLKDSGDLYAYVKVYEKNGMSDQCGINEVKKLKDLEKIKFENASVPEVLRVGENKKNFFFILSTKKGLKKYTRVEDAHIDWLFQLSKKTGEYTLFEKSRYYESLNREVDFLKSRFIYSADMIEELYKQAESGLRGKTFLFSLVMREFPFYQPLYSGNEFFCLDWEYAEDGFPPVFDFFSLIISGAVNVRKGGTYGVKYAGGVKDAFFGGNKKTKKYAGKLFDIYKLDRETAFWFFILYTLDQLYIHAGAGHNLSVERDIFLLDKIRKARELSVEKWL